MSKKSQRRGADDEEIPVVEDVIEYEDGGIYWHEKKIGEKRYFISPAEQAEILSKLDDHAGQLAAELARIEADDLPRGRSGNEHEQADAHDAAYLIRELRATVAHGGDCDALLLAYRLGRKVERMQVRPFERPAKLGKKHSREQRDKAQSKRLLSDAEWEKVCGYIAKRIGDGAKAAKACSEASSQLKTGQFPGIERLVPIEQRTLANRWSKRNQSSRSPAK